MLSKFTNRKVRCVEQMPTRLIPDGSSGWIQYVIQFLKSDLFLLLLACGLFRLFYYYGLLDTLHNPDSNTYLNFHENIFRGHVDALRTPVYPYFIKIMKIFGKENLIHHIILGQIVISFLTIIFFYNVTRIVFKTRAAIVLATLIYGIMPSFISFDKCILTESLSISVSTVFLWIVARYLAKPSAFLAVICTLYIVFAVLLRPSFIVLIPIMILFWGLRFAVVGSEFRNCLLGLAMTVFCIFFVMGYSYLNSKRNHSKSISIVYHINQLDNIINTGMYRNGNDPEISETIIRNMANATPPWNEKIREVLFKQYSKDRLAKFISACIINQSSAWLGQTYRKISVLSREKTTVSYVKLKEVRTTEFIFIANKTLAVPFFVIYILLVFDLFFMIVQWAIYRRFSWIKGFAWLFAVTYFFTVITGAQAEYKRLFVVALPFIIFLMFYYFDLIFNSLKNLRRGLSSISRKNP